MRTLGLTEPEDGSKTGFPPASWLIILNETRGTGTFFQTWDLRNDQGLSVASGVYFARLKTVDASLVKRIAVVR